MNSLLQGALGRGYDARRKLSREAVVFKGVRVTVPMINRDQSDRQLGGVIDVTMESGSIIEFPLGTVAPPVQGDSLTDAQGAIHSVRRAFHVGTAVKLVCAVIAP